MARRLPVAALAALVLLAAGSGAAAQSVSTSARPQVSDRSVELGERLAPEHLFGDWGGALPAVQAKGVDLTASYTSETAGVVSGGRRTGVDYAHSLNLEADVDWGKLAGLGGFSTHVAFVERAGRNASADFLSERLTEVQEIYGSGGNVALHLAYLYAQQTLMDGRLDLEGGRLDVGQEFATSPLYCSFMTLSVCPSPRALSIASGFTIFPTSTWGARVRGQPYGPFYVQAGAFQVRDLPLAGGRAGFDWGAEHTTGAFLPLEVGAELRSGPNRLVGHYKLGVAYNTSSFPDQWEGATAGAPFAAKEEAPHRHRGQALIYAAADQMLRRTGPNGTDGLIVLAGYAWADPHTALIAQQAFIGLLANGMLKARPKDSVGVLATWFEVSGQLSAAQALQARLGDPLSSGSAAIRDAPAGVQSHETVLEARYDAALCEGLHLMPDVQYVLRPDAVAAIPDATVVGLRITADF